MRVRSRIPVPLGSRTVNVDGVRVRAKLTLQFGQYYAEGKDAKGKTHAGVGKTSGAAGENLARSIRSANRYYVRH
jgi:hypothetical protein